MTRSPRKQAGFSLLEVVIALAILALGLATLLDAQSSSLRSTGRTRELTIATLLARSKMIDIEKELFDEGFVVGVQEDEGDFEEEGYRAFKWRSKVSELTLDLSALNSMLGDFVDDEEHGESQGENVPDVGSFLGNMGGPLTAFTDDIGRSLRLIELEIIWDVPPKYQESIKVSSLITREDYGFEKNTENPRGIVPLDPSIGNLKPANFGKK